VEKERAVLILHVRFAVMVSVLLPEMGRGKEGGVRRGAELGQVDASNSHQGDVESVHVDMDTT
jgi:hypothetical protein